ncbi:MAG: Na/Pi cotransporter family protein [Spirochaetota bacterium]|nr:Na/Pi cotransporter family protein [Spirochaetota bacterium]
MNGWSTTITILGGLGLFLFGMKIMSESLQKSAGDRLRIILGKATSNRFVGVIVGTTVTSIIQSSSATTVMLVSFVTAGLISLQQSIGIMFGANIGTTFTGWLVAILGFKVKVATFALPAIAIGFFLRFANKENLKYWGEFFLGFGLLFLGLNYISGAVNDLRNSEQVMNVMSKYSADTIFSAIIVVLIGAVITIIIQSSSATMAMTMALAVNGLIDFQTSCALILGENIGTTVTAQIASIGTTPDARRCAWAHLLFNTFGVLWILLLFHYFFIPLVDWIIPGDPYSSDIIERSTSIADHMAAFHTIFNVTNTLLFLPFVHILTWFANKMVPEGKADQREEFFHLKYISTTIMSTPSININQARQEIKRMIEIIIDMFDKVMNISRNPDIKLGTVVEEIQKKEEIIDLLEKEISTFLVKVSQHSISEEHSHEISMMLHTVNELERIGDHCEILLKLLRRKYETKLNFSERAYQEIGEISGKVKEFLDLLYKSITSSASNILLEASVIENRIDELRMEMRKRHIQRLNEGACDVQSGLIFLDMLTSFEKIGDHSLNVAEGLSGSRIF